MNKKIVLILILLISLIFTTTNVYATDTDGDGQHRPQDCDDNNYYRYYDAPEIPFDGLGNHCPNTRDSKLYDMNDLSAPSNNAIYYVGDTIQLIGYNFSYNKKYLITIADADNRVSFGPNPTRIDSIYINDTVKTMNIYTDSTGKVNESLYLPPFNPVYGEIEPYALGTWTIYFYFKPYNTSLPGYREYIPIDTFEVILPPLRLNITSPLNGETYYGGYIYDSNFNLQVSSNTQLANKQIDTWWYSLDGGPNTTFYPNITFNNIHLGEHTIIVYANDTEGNISQKQSTFELWSTETDKDGDGQDSNYASCSNCHDCDDKNHYRFTGAVNIPFDGIYNACDYNVESTLNDINDLTAPSNNVKYYLGDTMTLIGTNFRRSVVLNPQVRITVIDSRNKTYLVRGKIDTFDFNNIVFMNYTYVDINGNINRSFPLHTNHPIGNYTIYVYFTDSTGDQQEYIPVDTFEVVLPPLRLNIASPLNGETYYGGEIYNSNFNLQVSSNTQLANKQIDTWWYSLDGGPNTTFNPNITFYDINLGEHTIIVYANDTEGNISQKQSTFELWHLPYEKDGDGQLGNESDCLDYDYYSFYGAMNIPYDGKPNDCRMSRDSILYDMNDQSYPSGNATYYRGDQIQLIGDDFYPSEQVFIAVIDPRNVTENLSSISDDYITGFQWNNIIYMDKTTIPSNSQKLNQTITLGQNHPTGIYTIYIYFTWSKGSDGEHVQWIPVDTFTVVENHAPNATIQNITGYENTNITFQVPTTDLDGDPLTYSSDNPNITWNGTHLYYETDYETIQHPNLTKTITVNITADDTRLNYTQEVNITIIDVNRAPYHIWYPTNNICNITIDFTYVAEDSATNWTTCLDLSTIAFDPDGDELSYSFMDALHNPYICDSTVLFSEPLCEYLVDENNIFKYRVAKNYYGGCNTALTITDSYGLKHTNLSGNMFRIAPTSPNDDAPFLNFSDKTFYEGELADFEAPKIDYDCDPMTYTTNHSNITWDGTKLTWMPSYDEIQHPNQSINFSLNITGSDGKTDVSQIISVTLIDVNRAPYHIWYPTNNICNITIDFTYVAEDSATNWTTCLDLSTIAFDPDGDELSYSFMDALHNPYICDSTVLFSEPLCEYLVDENNIFKYRVAKNYYGGCNTALTITDSYGLKHTNLSGNMFRIAPTSPNEDAPFLTKPLPMITLFEDEYNDTWSPTSYFADYDCEATYFSIQNSTNIYSNNITWNFSSSIPDWFGEENLTLTATDNIEDTIVNLTVRVLPVNDAPTLETQVPDTNFDEDTTTEINFSDYFNDVDNATLTYTLSGNTEISIDTFTENLVTLTSTTNWNGNETITIHASDGEFEITDTFKVTINPINDAPTINVIAGITASERDTISLTPTATDVDNDPIVYYTNNSNLIWNPSTLSFEWTPTYNQSGNYTVNITVSDGIINDSTLTTIEVIDKYHRNDIGLRQGWNLVSYPYTLDNTSVADIMSDITSNYTIWSYDSSTGLWSDYDSSKVPQVNNLTDIENTDSFWINISNPENLTVIGTKPDSITINLNAGWNLISYPLDTQRLINTTLSAIDGKYTILWNYDSETSSWNLYNPYESKVSTLDYFIPQSGYWINMTESTTLTFSY